MGWVKRSSTRRAQGPWRADHPLQAEQAAATSTNQQLEDQLRLKAMELDGAKAQLQVRTRRGSNPKP